MDRNPVLQDLQAFHSTSAAPNTDYQTSKMTSPDQDSRVVFSMPPTTDTISSTDTQTTCFLDGLDFGFDTRLYQQQPQSISHQQPQSISHQQQQHQMHEQQQGLYSPNQFYQQSPQQQHMQHMQQQQYMPVYPQHHPHPHQLHNTNHTNNQILLQRYNSNGSTASSTNSQPSYYSPMGHYNLSAVQHQNDGNLNQMLYAQQQQHHQQQQQQQQQQHHLQQLQQSHNLQINKKRKAAAGSSSSSSADLHLLEDSLLQQQAGGGVQKKKTKAKKKKMPKVVDPNAPPKPKRKTGLNKPLILSSALSELMDGEKELSRPELVQKLWKYIKGNDLQDPADRRFILCDDKLKKIFDQDRINSFGMNKDLSAHLTKKEEPAMIQEEQQQQQQQQQQHQQQMQVQEGSEPSPTQTDTENDTKHLYTALSATTTMSSTTEDVATTAVALNEHAKLLQQETLTEEPSAIVTIKEEEEDYLKL